MELVESIDRINDQLVKHFGKELDGRPRFRVVWSNDQYEKRLSEYNSFGFGLLHPEVIELPKYSHYIRDRFILEHLVRVPAVTDLVSQTSYEPVWVFRDKDGNYLPPRFDACQLIIESLYYHQGRAGVFKKYKDNSASVEEKMKMLREVEEMLYGNETDVTDALAYGYGVAGFREQGVQENDSDENCSGGGDSDSKSDAEI